MNGAVSSRYAAALVDVALEHNNADRVRRDLELFAGAFESSTDLRIALESPAVTREVKLQVIQKLGERMDLTPAVRNFVSVLVDHRRTELLREIQQVFQAELNARQNIAEAEVTSARALSEDERKKLIETLKKSTGKEIEARFREDASLVGGTVVRIGSTVYDDSVRAQLNRMREQLEAE